MSNFDPMTGEPLLRHLFEDADLDGRLFLVAAEHDGWVYRVQLWTDNAAGSNVKVRRGSAPHRPAALRQALFGNAEPNAFRPPSMSTLIRVFEGACRAAGIDPADRDAADKVSSWLANHYFAVEK